MKLIQIIDGKLTLKYQAQRKRAQLVATAVVCLCVNLVFLDLVDLETPFYLMSYNILVPRSFALTHEMDCCYFKPNLQVMLSNRDHYPLGSTLLNCRCSAWFTAISL